jgi:PKD repeat protein
MAVSYIWRMLSGPMGGPAYAYDPDVAAEWPTAFPEEFDGIPLMYEWVRDYIKLFHLDEDGTDVAAIADMLPNLEFNAPMDMEFGPDGSLYVLEYGGGFFVEHELAQLSRVDYVADGRSPVARASAQPRSGQPPMEVAFSSEGTHHPDDEREIVSLEWAFGDGATSTEDNPTHTYTDRGVYTATLTVTDDNDRIGRAGITIVVGNTAPEVDLQLPVDGGFFGWGDEGGFRIGVTDAEDEQIDCGEVRLNGALGHDEHAHPMGEWIGCDGTFETPETAGHDSDLNVYWLLTASYTDQGADGLPQLTGTDQVLLQPKRKQAQFYDRASGVAVEPAGDSAEGGGQRLTSIDDGDWAAYEPVNLLNIDEVTVRIRAEQDGGAIELRANAPDGDVIASIGVPDTAGEWVSVTTEIDDPGETISLYLVFTHPDGGSDLFNVNFFEAIGEGIAGPPPAPVCTGTIVFGSIDSGVEDRDAGDGRCVGDLLEDGRDWPNHGAFVAHVRTETAALVADGVLSSAERTTLVRTAARSDVGKS